jgi:hypothetical protein
MHDIIMLTVVMLSAVAPQIRGIPVHAKILDNYKHASLFLFFQCINDEDKEFDKIDTCTTSKAVVKTASYPVQCGKKTWEQ